MKINKRFVDISKNSCLLGFINAIRNSKFMEIKISNNPLTENFSSSANNYKDNSLFQKHKILRGEIPY